MIEVQVSAINRMTGTFQKLSWRYARERNFWRLLRSGLWLQRWSLKLLIEQIDEKCTDYDQDQPTQRANFPTNLVHLVIPRNAEQESLGLGKE